jgi:hypothetical protein
MYTKFSSESLKERDYFEAYNIKMDDKIIGYQGLDWTHSVLCRKKSRALLITVKHFGVLQKVGNLVSR